MTAPNQARAIVAELPAEVDPDLVEARQILAEQGYSHDYEPNEADTILSMVLSALKRGREFERGEGK